MVRPTRSNRSVDDVRSSAGCGNWTPEDSNASRLAIYEACPGLIVRHVRGAFDTPNGAWAQWTFHAPPGTFIGSAQLAGTGNASAGWQTLIFTNTGMVLAVVPGRRMSPLIHDHLARRARGGYRTALS